MLTRVAEAVFVHRSAFCESNSVVVHGDRGVLIVDAGVHESEISCLAGDLSALGRAAEVGFSTHPHWDHLLWHELLGDAPRYGTARCAEVVRERLSGGIDASRFGIPEDVSLSLLGDIAGLSENVEHVPWDGPQIRIIEHQAHAPGHAALLIAQGGVLIAGDMLSDVLVPMLDFTAAGDPVESYLASLRLLEGVAGHVEILIPGHGSVGNAGELRERIARDRAYVVALRDGRDSDDPRIGSSAQAGWEWVSDVHDGQVRRLRSE